MCRFYRCKGYTGLINDYLNTPFTNIMIMKRESNMAMFNANKNYGIILFVAVFLDRELVIEMVD